MDRNRTTFVLLATALLAAGALSGCIGSAQATAFDHRDVADEEADRWHEESRLVNVLGFEGRPMKAQMEHRTAGPTPDEARTYRSGVWADEAGQDPDVGDGEARFWVYRYLGPDGEKVLEVVVDERGEVRDRRVVDADEDDVLLGPVELDSTEAVETARTVDEFEEALASERSHLMLVLDREPDQEHARWHVGVLHEDGFVVVTIDAVTGEIVGTMTAEDMRKDTRTRTWP